MKYEEPFTNEELLEQKKICIAEFPLYPFKFIKTFTYHGVKIEFHTDHEFILSKLDELPPHWYDLGQDLEFKLYHRTPQEFGHNLEDWCDESSQECLIGEDNLLAIQRDFISERAKNADSFIAIFEDDLSDGFYNFMRWALPKYLIKKNIYLLHCSSILNKNNEAMIFLGHSGAGKTTITKLSENYPILGDDMNLLIQDDGHFKILPGCIGGTYPSTVGYDKAFRIKSIYWLKQANETRKEKLQLSKSLAKIIASFTNIFWGKLSSLEIELAIQTAEILARKVSVYDLYFKKNRDFHDVIE